MRMPSEGALHRNAFNAYVFTHISSVLNGYGTCAKQYLGMCWKAPTE